MYVLVTTVYVSKFLWLYTLLRLVLFYFCECRNWRLKWSVLSCCSQVGWRGRTKVLSESCNDIDIDRQLHEFRPRFDSSASGVWWISVVDWWAPTVQRLYVVTASSASSVLQFRRHCSYYVCVVQVCYRSTADVASPENRLTSRVVTMVCGWSSTASRLQRTAGLCRSVAVKYDVLDSLSMCTTVTPALVIHQRSLAQYML